MTGVLSRAIAGVIAGFLLLSSVAAAQTASPGSADAADPAVQATLANGMRVVLLPNHLAPVATTVMVYNVGSDDDTMPGIAHATEHMMFRGTQDVSATQLALMMARAGAQYDASTGNTRTQYYFTLPSPYVDLALRIAADRMTGALMRESDWQTERGAIEQEVRAHQSIPGMAAFAQMRQAIFGDTPYAQDGVGTIASFEAMHASDIAAFYHRWYHPNNALLIVSGDIDPAALLATIHSLFDPIPAAKLPPHTSVDPVFTASALHGTVAELPVPVALSAYRFPSLSSADYDAGQVLSAALDSSQGAFRDLMVQGKILVGLALAGAYPQTGTMMVMGAGVPGSSPQAVADALDGAIAAYRQTGIPADLVNEVKFGTLAEQALSEASIPGLAFGWAQADLLGDSSPSQLYDRMRAVTVDDVNRLLRADLDPKHSVTLLLKPGGFSTAPHADPKGGAADSVAVTPEREEPLPSWAASYFDAPIRVPKNQSTSVTYHLKNGLTLIVRPESTAPAVVVAGEVQSNTDLNEPIGKDGVGDLTAALLPLGTTTYDRTAFQAQAAAIGAKITLGTSFGAVVQSAYFHRAIALLANGMLDPAFLAKHFDVLKRTTAGTLAASQGLPATQAAIAQLNAMYPPGDPHRRHETAQSIEAVTLADVRRWYSFAYRPELTTIAIVGDVTPEQARAAIQHYFGPWQDGTKEAPSFAYPPVPQRKGKSVTIISPSSTHADVTLTQPLNIHQGADDVVALQLANTMLSEEGMGSVLFRDLRTQHGYVYDVSSDLSVDTDGSIFSIDFSADQDNVNRAQALALADIRDMQTNLVSERDLQRAKAMLVARRVLPLDSYSGIAADVLARAEDGLSRHDDDTYWKRLLNTTPQQVRAAMRKWIHVNRFTRVLVKPA